MSWDVEEFESQPDVLGVCWHKDRFVAVGRKVGFEQPVVVGVIDPRTGEMTPGVAPIDRHLVDCASNGHRCVAVTESGGMVASLDGLTWTDVSPASPEKTEAIEYVLGQFCAVGGPRAFSDESYVQVSQDGLNWTSQLIESVDGLKGVASNGTTALALGFRGAVIRSSDLLNWTESSAMPGTVR